METDKNTKKILEVFSKLEKAGYRTSKKKFNFFLIKMKWIGHEINENGIPPKEEKVEAILKFKRPENTKKLNSFLGAIQHTAIYQQKPLEQTDRSSLFSM